MKKAAGGKVSRISSDLYSWAGTVAFATVLAIFINCFIFRVSGVNGESMMSTLYDGDRVILQVLGYNQPDYDDIIVFRTTAKPEDPFVKRVIALAGDVVNIDRATGAVFVNGVLLEEEYINEMTARFGDIAYPFTVPQGCVFVMGDNRNHSTDSRESLVGPVPLKDITGRAILRIWPINRFGPIR